MSHVLLTGASGFIGGHLAARLVARGDDVRCLVRTTSKTDFLESLGVELVYGGLAPGCGLDSALQDREVVYHLAGLTSAFRSADLWRVNAEGTAALVSSVCPSDKASGRRAGFVTCGSWTFPIAWLANRARSSFTGIQLRTQ